MSDSLDFLYILIPCAIVVLLLKFCLIFCRAYYYQKKRQRQAQRLQQQRRMEIMASLRAQQARANVLRITASNREQGVVRIIPVSSRPGGARPTASPCTVIITSDQLRRVLNPNIPPSYDQAVTGKDKSVKLEDGTAGVQSNVTMETVHSDDSPPEYTPFSQSTDDFPTAPPPPPPPSNSHSPAHENEESGSFDDDELLLA